MRIEKLEVCLEPEITGMIIILWLYNKYMILNYKLKKIVLGSKGYLSLPGERG